jgi:excisionase family DNA binding protein
MNAQATRGYAEHPTALLPDDEARAHLGAISRTTLWRLRRRGEIGCVRIGRRVLYPVGELDAYIERNRERAPS